MFLKRLRIKDVRSIADLDLSLVDDSGEIRRWTLLLGENGTGKSTVLRCIALLLCGRDALPELLRPDPSAWIRTDRSTARVSGLVTTAQGDEREIALELRRGEGISKTLDRNASSLASLESDSEGRAGGRFVAGYGASRRLGRAGIGTYGAETGHAGPVRTLFDTDAALVPLASWAMDLEYSRGETALDPIRSTLSTLLPGVTFRHIDKDRKSMVFDTPDGPVSLADLSDGYQNVAAWVGDLLYRTTTVIGDLPDLLATRGLLLLDEIDLHLHPRWQRRLRIFLKEKLQNLQVVATTHSPMTSQQAGPGEVFILSRPSPKEPPALRGYKGDPRQLGLHQIIEPFFGVDTVESERLATLKDEYRRLAAKKGRSSSDNCRLEYLRAQLADAPEWHGGTEMKAQTEALRSIQELLEKAGVDLSKPPGGESRRAKP